MRNLMASFLFLFHNPSQEGPFFNINNSARASNGRGKKNLDIPTVFQVYKNN